MAMVALAVKTSRDESAMPKKPATVSRASKTSRAAATAMR